MKRFIGLVVAVATAALNWWVFYSIAVHFHSQDPWFMATALLASVVVHELGHLSVLEANGIRTYLVFLVILGGAIPDPSQKARLNHLPWNTKALIYLAGVFGNTLVIIAGLVMMANDAITPQQYQSLVNLNAVLILFNLFPVFIFDGGRFAKVLFDSIPEDKDAMYVFVIWAVYAVAVGTVSLLTHQLYTTGLLVLLWGLHFQAKHDDVNGSHNRLAMKSGQIKAWATVYVLLLAVSLYLSTLSKTWMY